MKGTLLAPTPDPTVNRPLRRAKFAAGAITVVLLLIGLWEGSTVLQIAWAGMPDVTIGMDLHIYIARARDWQDGDGFYQARQLQGPYAIENGDALYPPTLLYLLLPFCLGAPYVLWWAIPLAILVAVIPMVRPSWWAYPVLASLLVYPRTWEVLLYGNPSMWVFAAIAAGCAWQWPTVFAVLKPTLAPLALLGVKSRAWWYSFLFLVLLSIPLAPSWLDYARALLDARNVSLGPLYTFGEWPIALALLLALGTGSGGCASWTVLRRRAVASGS